MFESLYMNRLFIIEIDILESGRNAFVTPLKRKSLCTILWQKYNDNCNLLT